MAAFNQTFVFGADFEPVAIAARQANEKIQAEMRRTGQFWQEVWNIDETQAVAKVRRMVAMTEEELKRQRQAYITAKREGAADHAVASGLLGGRDVFGNSIGRDDIAKLDAYRAKGQAFRREMDGINESAGRMKGIWHNVGFAIEDALVVGTMKGMEFSDVLRASANNLSTIAMLAAPDKGMGAMAFTILPAAVTAAVALDAALNDTPKKIAAMREASEAYLETLAAGERKIASFGLTAGQKRAGFMRAKAMEDMAEVKKMADEVAVADIALKEVVDRQKGFRRIPILDPFGNFNNVQDMMDKGFGFFGFKTSDQQVREARNAMDEKQRLLDVRREQMAVLRQQELSGDMMAAFNNTGGLLGRMAGGVADRFRNAPDRMRQAFEMKRAGFDAWQAGERARIQQMEADPAMGKGHFRVQQAREQMEADAAKQRALLEAEEARLKVIDRNSEALQSLTETLGRMINNGRFNWMLGMPGGN